jgi:hypothetical protein
MTREDVIGMARKSGFLINGVQEFVFAPSSFHFTEELSAFAALVAAAERESCAKVCDALAAHPEYASEITKLAAHAIRARSKA